LVYGTTYLLGGKNIYSFNSRPTRAAKLGKSLTSPGGKSTGASLYITKYGTRLTMKVLKYWGANKMEITSKMGVAGKNQITAEFIAQYPKKKVLVVSISEERKRSMLQKIRESRWCYEHRCK